MGSASLSFPSSGPLGIKQVQQHILQLIRHINAMPYITIKRRSGFKSNIRVQVHEHLIRFQEP